ncbi:hypothetical protein C2G38_2224976 [Gigaspora rosea]|uniref:Uncharacterized protein n=1 Tax=Gigaspora rosea TaxID=44941 RepID=A0A397U8K7_9GLOM|nr:hypothetical protein C2G38_2224976 [Gigaspora rosea]
MVEIAKYHGGNSNLELGPCHLAQCRRWCRLWLVSSLVLSLIPSLVGVAVVIVARFVSNDVDVVGGGVISIY